MNRSGESGTGKTRRTDITVALIGLVGALGAALIGAAATLISGGDDSPSDPPSPPAQTSATARSEPSSSESAGTSTPVPGEVSLLDEAPVGSDPRFVVDSAEVGRERHDRALVFSTAWPSGGNEYTIPEGMRTFHARAGLTDDSESCSGHLSVLVDGEEAREFPIEVGAPTEINVDVEGAYRLKFTTSLPCFEMTPVVLDPVLRP